MAPRRRKAAHATPQRSKPKRALSTAQDPYQSLVAEYLAAEASGPTETENEHGRSSKRRRVDESGTENEDLTSLENEDHFRPPSKQQLAYNDSDDDITDEFSDADFEDVVLSGAPRSAANSNTLGDLNLTLGGKDVESQKRLSTGRRKALTSADRKMRLEIHKTHVLALLGHGRLRNQWCNDDKVQAAFRGFLPASVRKMFKDDTTQTQWQRSRSLKMGLEKAAEVLKDHFQVTARGATRSYWSESSSSEQIDTVPDDIDLPIEKEDFQDLATKRKGSRDVGAQLFCSLLRSLGLDVRLICSLQPLPMRATFRPATLTRPPPVIVPFHDNRTGMQHDRSRIESSMESQAGTGSVSQGVRRFGHAANKTNTTPTKAPAKQRIHESPYPVYWVEIFNIADQKWIPVDPLVLKIVDKPSKYEPPANDAENCMSYVIAIDEDGYMKDVTRRYAHAYNAKTRRNRVECSKDGAKWWEMVMRAYHDPLPQDRDQVEDAELTAKEAREPMPRNIVEFKNHPYYALERHLRQNEVLEPKRQVGTVSSGNNKNVEAVYRRNDVRTVRSADAWFRKGHQVKLGEVPLKYLEPKKAQGQRTKDDDLEEEEAEIPGIHPGTPLFAEYQTEQYTPPPILNGIVPKNIYGNIDVYTSWMVPAGGVWINHPFAGGAARLLSIDWADAVTGFEFRGRTGTAVVKGVVVAGEHHEAVVETIKGLQYAIEQEEIHNRSIQVLQTWKRFLIALRIRERIKSYHVEGEELEEAAKQDSESEYEDESSSDDENAGGGFLRGPNEPQSETDISMPRPAPQEIQYNSDTLPKALQDAMAPILSTWGESLPEITNAPVEPFQDYNLGTGYDGTSGGFFPEATEFPEYAGGGFLPDAVEVSNDGGGFLPDPCEIEGGGGFIPDPDYDTREDTTSLQATAESVPQQIPQIHTEEKAEAKSDILTETEKNEAVQPGTSKSILTRTESALSSKSTTSKASAGSLLSHDPEDDDAEPEWI